MNILRNKKILENTAFLYVRQVVVVAIHLYTLRLVLNTLGVEDFGLYTVVAGFVALLSFLPGTMASATQRFFSVAIGQEDQEKLHQTFSVNWMLYGLIAIFIFVILETVGYWYVSEYLSIPDERRSSAHVLYHYAVAGFVISVFSSPFIAILIAHEDMHVYALISIFDAALKLGAAVTLIYLPWDKLAAYGQLLLVVAAVTTSAYVLVSVKKYAECQFRKLYWEQVLVKEILGFTGWTLFGQISTVFRSHAVTILINQLFSPTTVAARAIATTVASQVMVFSQNFNTGLYPSIIKTYSVGQQSEMQSLVLNGSKFTFLLMWIFALPLLVEMEAVMTLWLKTPPDESILFTRLAIVESLILSLSLPITTAARAPGRMRLYELSLGTIQILVFIVSWSVLKMDYPAESVFIVAILANLLMFKVRLLIVNRLVNLSIVQYYKRVVWPVVVVVLVSSLAIFPLSDWLPAGIMSTFLVVSAGVGVSTICMYYLGLDRVWRKRARDFLLVQLTMLRTNR